MEDNKTKLNETKCPQATPKTLRKTQENLIPHDGFSNSPVLRSKRLMELECHTLLLKVVQEEIVNLHGVLRGIVEIPRCTLRYTCRLDLVLEEFVRHEQGGLGIGEQLEPVFCDTCVTHVDLKHIFSWKKMGD